MDNPDRDQQELEGWNVEEINNEEEEDEDFDIAAFEERQNEIWQRILERERNQEPPGFFQHPVEYLAHQNEPPGPILTAKDVEVVAISEIAGGVLHHEVFKGGAANNNTPEEEKVKRRKDKLSTDLGQILNDSVMTDFSVQTSRNTYMAHKAILAARSSVFAAMFNTNMIEKELNSVEISDFEDDIVKAMLDYFYTGETDLLNERAPELLQLGEKYDLAGLKEDCEYVMAENLSVENAVQLLVMADMYNASILKPRVLEYINLHSDEVKRTKHFLEMAQDYPNLVVDLYLS